MNEFEIAVVKESSAFEPSKFQCISVYGHMHRSRAKETNRICVWAKKIIKTYHSEGFENISSGLYLIENSRTRGQTERRMGDLQFYVLFNIISIIHVSGR